jgi:hypothetical protein
MITTGSAAGMRNALGARHFSGTSIVEDVEIAATIGQGCGPAAKIVAIAEMARVTGLEPATSGVTGRRSNQLSYTRVVGAT